MPEQDIRIDLRQGATVVNVVWPVAQASEWAAYRSTRKATEYLLHRIQVNQ